MSADPLRCAWVHGVAGYEEAEPAVAAALRGLGLDVPRAGSDAWSPLAELVAPGGTVVLKPNFIRHWNPLEGRGGTLASVITHGSLIRAMAAHAFRAVGATGRVVIAEAPQQDCDFEAIRSAVALDEMVAEFAAQGLTLEVIDLRRERVVFEQGVVRERIPLPGDPAGYRAVDLGRRSFFEGSGLDPARMRGADYDPGPTNEHHRGGRNAYLLSETVLRADLIVNLPKLKTHKKTGVTLALKNLVGINGDKNWLPHHCAGSPAEGGDEFPGGRLDTWRNRALDAARPLLQAGRLRRVFGAARALETGLRGDDFVRAGNWWGNRTTWRMCCDLNRALYHSDAEGLHLDAPAPVRRVLTLLDGIVAGEAGGPLAPRDVALGALVAGLDPIAVDLVAVRLMGFDPDSIPKIREPMRDPGSRITVVQRPEEVRVVEVPMHGGSREIALASVRCARPFEPHPGWVGHIEAGRAVRAVS